MQKARPDPQKILVLNDGVKGNLNQALGIAQAFPSADIDIFDIQLKGPVYYLPARKGVYPLASKFLSIMCILRLWRCGKFFLKTLLIKSAGIWRKNFDIVISAGSILSPVNLILARTKKAISVNIMVPSLIPVKFFDFAVIPYHDFIRLRNKKLKNLIVTLGAPNCITDDMLERERKRLVELLGMPQDKKVIAVIIGGDDQNYTVSVRWTEKLFKYLELLEESYNFILTTSRRTDVKVISFIQQRVKEERAFIYKEFPGYSNSTLYPGIISLCDYIFVTEDSINMVSEAASCGVPVFILGVERKKEKKLIFDKALEKLVEKGYAEYLPVDELDNFIERFYKIKDKKFTKLNEARECVQKILQSII
ncbi:MAG: mitochondrial fission ELM1 family protein [Candidatus Omnitrophica bacterium]|nr:mitochondrial fission ELM1 family protein [Candidatus Omnitrophota bacterium]